MFKNPFKDEIAAKPEHLVLRAAADDGLAADDLQPNEFYFEIRLCELYMRKSGESGRSFIPRVLAITDCLYQNNEMTLPVAVGQKILDRIGAQLKAGQGEIAISLSNCLLAGPMPYCGGDINFFGGLYRVESGNWADSAFNLVADLTDEFGLDVSKYLSVGRKLAAGLPVLLGTESSDWRFGHYGPLYTESDDFFDRYLVLLGTEGSSLEGKKLEVRREDTQETLYASNGRDAAPYCERDFALFRLRSRASRGDYSRFQFNNRFNEARNLLTNGNKERFEWARLQLLQEISECADLTERHKLKLIAMFDLKLENWSQAVRAKPDAKRGGASPAASSGAQARAVEKAIGALAATAAGMNLSENTVATFAELQGHWQLLSKAPAIAKDADLTDGDIENFLTAKETEGIFRGTSADFLDTVKAQRLHAG